MSIPPGPRTLKDPPAPGNWTKKRSGVVGSGRAVCRFGGAASEFMPAIWPSVKGNRGEVQDYASSLHRVINERAEELDGERLYKFYRVCTTSFGLPGPPGVVYTSAPERVWEDPSVRCGCWRQNPEIHRIDRGSGYNRARGSRRAEAQAAVGQTNDRAVHRSRSRDLPRPADIPRNPHPRR